ncbi:unnamed protein product, partial [Rotaria sp. Silwood1]
ITENDDRLNISQIFDINHLQDVLNAAHVCYRGGRLEFISDVAPSTGLFHQNVLRCTKCGIETPLTNFRIIHPIESTQQEPNQRLILACGTTGVGYRATKHQQFCNRNYDGTSKSMEREGVKKLFQRSLINGLRYKHMVCDGDASAFEAIKYYYIQHHHQQQRTSSDKGKEDEDEEGTEEEEGTDEEEGTEEGEASEDEDEEGTEEEEGTDEEGTEEEEEG